MRKEFLEMANDPGAEVAAPRKRGRPPKNAAPDANGGDAQPKAKRPKKAPRPAKPSAEESGDDVGSDAEEPAAAPKAKKTGVKKEVADEA